MALDPGMTAFQRQVSAVLVRVNGTVVARDLLSTSTVAYVAASKTLLDTVVREEAALEASVKAVVAAAVPTRTCDALSSGLVEVGRAVSIASSISGSTLGTPSRMTAAVASLSQLLSVRENEPFCEPCAQGAISIIRSEVLRALDDVSDVDYLTSSVSTLLATRAAALSASEAASTLKLRVGTCTVTLSRAVSGLTADEHPVPVDTGSLTAFLGALVEAKSTAVDALERASGIDSVLRSFVSSASVVSTVLSPSQTAVVDRFASFATSYVNFGTALEGILNARELSGLFSLLDTTVDVVNTILPSVRLMEHYLQDVNHLFEVANGVVVEARGLVGTVRDKLQYAVRLLEGDPDPNHLLALPLPTCKNTTDVAAPPCLHAVHRVREEVRDYLFPLNFPMLFALTNFGRQSLPAAGVFDGYTLASTAFLGAGSSRLILSLYNANAAHFGEITYPPVLVVHSNIDVGGGGSILRVLELYESDTSPVGEVTGVAVTQAQAGSRDGSVLVSGSRSSDGVVWRFSSAEVVSKSSGANAGTAAGVLVALSSAGLPTTPAGGVSFFRKEQECYMLAAQGGADEESASVHVFEMNFACDWFASEKIIDGALRETASFAAVPFVKGLVAFRHSTDTLFYTAITRCTIKRGYTCGLEFHSINISTWTFNSTVLYSLGIPVGSVGLDFDPEDASGSFASVQTTSPQFIFGCSGTAEANLMQVVCPSLIVFRDRWLLRSFFMRMQCILLSQVKSTGKLLEGRVMVVDKASRILILSLEFLSQCPLCFA